MHILFAGGGTAGHINPALAVAGLIRKNNPDATISYIGKKDGMEQRLVTQAGFDFYPIEVEGIQRKISLENIKRNAIAIKKVFTSSALARKYLKELNPDVVVGTGGYVSGPVLREAHKLGIKIAIHEQNAFPGVTTKMLAPKADLVMLAMSQAKDRMNYKGVPVITGNPIRSEMTDFSKEAAREKLGLKPEDRVVLSMGGSLGADRINEAIIKLIAENYKSGEIYFIHGTGKRSYDRFIKQITAAGVDISDPHVIIKDYLDNTVCIPAADLIISRAGAISLTEIGVCAKPAIFIPSPNVAENHQYYNALSLKNAGAAELLQEDQLYKLGDMVKRLIFDDKKLYEMSEKSAGAVIPDAAKRIYDEVIKLYNK